MQVVAICNGSWTPSDSRHDDETTHNASHKVCQNTQYHFHICAKHTTVYDDVSDVLQGVQFRITMSCDYLASGMRLL